MKNKLMKLMCMMSVMLFGLTGTVFASGNALTDGGNISIGGIGKDNNNTAADSIIGNIQDLVGKISIVVIFVSVVMVGFEIIMKRNKADERMESMTSLMWVGIGALVLGSAGLIFSLLKL